MWCKSSIILLLVALAVCRRPPERERVLKLLGYQPMDRGDSLIDRGDTTHPGESLIEEAKKEQKQSTYFIFFPCIFEKSAGTTDARNAMILILDKKKHDNMVVDYDLMEPPRRMWHMFKDRVVDMFDETLPDGAFSYLSFTDIGDVNTFFQTSPQPDHFCFPDYSIHKTYYYLESIHKFMYMPEGFLEVDEESYERLHIEYQNVENWESFFDPWKRPESPQPISWTLHRVHLLNAEDQLHAKNNAYHLRIVFLQKDVEEVQTRLLSKEQNDFPQLWNLRSANQHQQKEQEQSSHFIFLPCIFERSGRTAFARNGKMSQIALDLNNQHDGKVVVDFDIMEPPHRMWDMFKQESVVYQFNEPLFADGAVSYLSFTDINHVNKLFKTLKPDTKCFRDYAKQPKKYYLESCPEFMYMPVGFLDVDKEPYERLHIEYQNVGNWQSFFFQWTCPGSARPKISWRLHRVQLLNSEEQLEDTFHLRIVFLQEDVEEVAVRLLASDQNGISQFWNLRDASHRVL